MTKIGKKLAAVLLAVAMIVTFMPVVGAQTAYADATPAALDPESITVQILDSSSLIAYPGDTVRISMTITNHNSDLSPMIWSKRPQTGDTSFTGYMKREGETNTWYIDIPISEGDQSGIWKLNNIKLFSTDGTGVWYINIGGDGSPEDHYVDLSRGNYEVSGTSPDTTPPSVDLTTLEIAPFAVNSGETVTFSVPISDENEIASTTSIFLKDPNGNIVSWLPLSLNADTGKYEYKMPVTAETVKGTWSIYCFFVDDTSGNDEYVYLSDSTGFFVNDITHAVVADIPEKVYDGTPYDVDPVVYFGNKTLVNGTDYYLSYPECEGNTAPTAVGEYKVSITSQGDYIGSIGQTFTIVPASVEGADVNGISDKTYTGKAITQTPVVKVGGTTLKSGTDYTVSYKNNTNVGTAEVIITGKGNCTGTITKTFKITKAANPLKVSAGNAAVKYSKLKKKTQTLAVTKVIKFTKDAKDKKTYTLSSAKKGSKSFKKYFKINKTTGKVTIKKNSKMKKGTYKVKVKVKALGNSNYKASGDKTVTFKVRVK